MKYYVYVFSCNRHMFFSKLYSYIQQCILNRWVKILYIKRQIFVKFLLLIFLNHLITLIVLYHSFTLNLLTNSVSIWSNICLLILSISLLDEFMNLVLGCYRVIRELPVPFILILSNAFAGFANLVTSL